MELNSVGELWAWHAACRCACLTTGMCAGNWYRRVTSCRRQPAAEKGLVRGAGSRRESRAFAAGTLAFGALLWLAGAAPWSLPAVYLAFAAVALPYRAVEFGFTRNAPFLLDFCYVSSRPSLPPPSHPC